MNMKKIFTVFLILITALIIANALILNVEAAAEKCPICGNNHDLSSVGGMQAWTQRMANTIYGSDIISDETNEVLAFNVAGTRFNTLWERGRQLYEMFSMLGSLLVCVYVMYDLLTKSAGDNLTAESFAKAMMRLCAGIIIINNGYDLIGYGSEFMTAIFWRISPQSPSGGVYPMKDYCPFGDLVLENMFDAMVRASGLFIPWLVMLLAGAIITITCWSRVLDIMMRVIFAPIGMSDIINDGTRSSGWKYFKRLMASILQGSVIIAAARAYALIMPVIMKMNGFLAWLMPIVLAFVMIAMMFKASMVANDIVG